MTINKESSDKEILDFKIGEIAVREIGAMSFMGWVANKLNGVDTYKAATQELLMLVSSPPLGKLPEGEKIRIVKKLLEIKESL